jgi:hypothetical protein
MSPYVNSLLFILYFVFCLIALYALIKTVTVAVMDAKSESKERNKNNG